MFGKGLEGVRVDVNETVGTIGNAKSGPFYDDPAEALALRVI